MNRGLSATFGLFLCLTVTEASAQEAKPGLDLKSYAEDMMRCGHEDVWDICKQCVNDAWNGAQVPWELFCEYLTETGFSAEVRAACDEEQSQSRPTKLSWCMTIQPDDRVQPVKPRLWDRSQIVESTRLKQDGSVARLRRSHP